VTDKLEIVLGQVKEEMDRATRKFPRPFHSNHEGYAVVEEEFLEFQDECFHGNPIARYNEAKQLAAMAIRYMVDLYEHPTKGED
jgi:hypothetical protein